MGFYLFVLFVSIPRSAQALRVRQQLSLPSCLGSGSAITSNGCNLARYISLSQQDAYPALMRLSTAVAGASSQKNQSEFSLSKIANLKVNQFLANAIPLAVNDLNLGTSTAISQFYSNSNSSLNNVTNMVSKVESGFANTQKSLNNSAQIWLNEMNRNDLNSINALITIANTLNGNSAGSPIYDNVTGIVNSGPASLNGHANYIADLADNITDLQGAIRNNITLLETNFNGKILDLQKNMTSFMTVATGKLQNSTAASVNSMVNNISNLLTPASTDVNSTISRRWANRNKTISQLLGNVSVVFRSISAQTETANATVFGVTNQSNLQLAAQGANATQRMNNSYNALNSQSYSLGNTVQGVYSPVVNTWGIYADGTLSNLTSSLSSAGVLIQQALTNGSNNSLAQTLLNSMGRVGSIQQSINDVQARTIQQNMATVSNVTNKLKQSGVSFQALMANLSSLQTIMSTQFDSSSTNSSSNTTSKNIGLLNGLQAAMQSQASAVGAAVGSANANLANAKNNVKNVIGDFSRRIASNATFISGLLDSMNSAAKNAKDDAVSKISEFSEYSSRSNSRGNGRSSQATRQNSVTQGLLAGMKTNVSELALKTRSTVDARSKSLMPSFSTARRGLKRILSNLIGQVTIQSAPTHALSSDLSMFRTRYNNTASTGISSLTQTLNSILPLASGWSQRAGTLYNMQAPLMSKNASSVSNFTLASKNEVSASLSELSSLEAAPLETESVQSSVQSTLHSPSLDSGKVTTSVSAISGQVIVQNTSLIKIASDLSFLKQRLDAQVVAFNQTSSDSVKSILSLVNTARKINNLLNQETSVLNTDIVSAAAADTSQVNNYTATISNLSSVAELAAQSALLSSLAGFTNATNSAQLYLISNHNGSLKPLPGFPNTSQVNASIFSSISNASNLTSALNAELLKSANALVAYTHQSITTLNASLVRAVQQLAAVNTTAPNIAILQSLLANVSQNLAAVTSTASRDIMNLAGNSSFNISTQAKDLQNMRNAVKAALDSANAMIGDGKSLSSTVEAEMASQLELRRNSISLLKSQIGSSGNQMQPMLAKAIKSAVAENSNLTLGRNVSHPTRMMIPILKLWNAFIENEIPYMQKIIDQADLSLQTEEKRLMSVLQKNQARYVEGANAMGKTISDFSRYQFDLDDRIVSANYSLGNVQEPLASPINGTNVSTTGILELRVSPSALLSAKSDQAAAMSTIQSDVNNMLRGVR